MLPGTGFIYYCQGKELLYVNPFKNFVVWENKPNTKSLIQNANSNPKNNHNYHQHAAPNSSNTSINSIMKGSGTLFTKSDKIIQGEFSTYGIPLQAFMVDSIK